MKFNPTFELRDVCGEQVLLPTGLENINFSSLINLNETAADIYKHFQEKEFELVDIVEFIMTNYEVVDRKQVEKDITLLLESLHESGVIV